MPTGIIHAWSSWDIVAAFYDGKFTAGNFSPMATFVRQVAQSSYSRYTYPPLSHATLMVAQRPRFDFKHEVLEVTFLPASEQFRFEYWEHPSAKRHWVKECALTEAFGTFVRVLHLKKWQTEEKQLDGTVPITARQREQV